MGGMCVCEDQIKPQARQGCVSSGQMLQHQTSEIQPENRSDGSKYNKKLCGCFQVLSSRRKNVAFPFNFHHFYNKIWFQRNHFDLFLNLCTSCISSQLHPHLQRKSHSMFPSSAGQFSCHHVHEHWSKHHFGSVVNWCFRNKTDFNHRSQNLNSEAQQDEDHKERRPVVQEVPRSLDTGVGDEEYTLITSEMTWHP